VGVGVCCVCGHGGPCCAVTNFGLSEPWVVFLRFVTTGVRVLWQCLPSTLVPCKISEIAPLSRCTRRAQARRQRRPLPQHRGHDQAHRRGAVRELVQRLRGLQVAQQDRGGRRRAGVGHARLLPQPRRDAVGAVTVTVTSAFQQRPLLVIVPLLVPLLNRQAKNVRSSSTSRLPATRNPGTKGELFCDAYKTYPKLIPGDRGSSGTTCQST
jgi:hypothetical protein